MLSYIRFGSQSKWKELHLALEEVVCTRGQRRVQEVDLAAVLCSLEHKSVTLLIVV